MRATIYKQISDALAALPEIAHINLFNNQVVLAEEEQPFKVPAVFVEFGTIDWKHQLHGVRDAVVQVRLHVVTDSRVSPWSDTIQVFDLLDRVNATLHGLSATLPNGSVMNALTLEQSLTDHYFDELQENVEVYACHVTDCSGYRR